MNRLVWDGLFDPNLLDRVRLEFPAPWDDRWTVYGSEHEIGKQEGGPMCWGPATLQLLDRLTSAEACEWIADVLGLDCELRADTIGGGMHQSPPGAFLDVHVDFSRHPVWDGWDRRVNLLVYLNEDWTDEDGGTLVLGDERIVPTFNRTVMFETTDESWHGHPDPVKDRVRRSIAVYYYSPTGERSPHSTVWHG